MSVSAKNENSQLSGMGHSRFLSAKMSADCFETDNGRVRLQPLPKSILKKSTSNSSAGGSISGTPQLRTLGSQESLDGTTHGAFSYVKQKCQILDRDDKN